MIARDFPKTKSAASGKAAQRNLYRITAAGRKRFRALMLEAVPYGAYETDSFVSKLGYFDYITSSEQKTILQHHRGYVQASLDFIERNLTWVMQNQEIPVVERNRIEWVTEFRLRPLRAEVAWVEQAISNTE